MAQGQYTLGTRTKTNQFPAWCFPHEAGSAYISNIWEFGNYQRPPFAHLSKWLWGESWQWYCQQTSERILVPARVSSGTPSHGMVFPICAEFRSWGVATNSHERKRNFSKFFLSSSKQYFSENWVDGSEKCLEVRQPSFHWRTVGVFRVRRERRGRQLEGFLPVAFFQLPSGRRGIWPQRTTVVLFPRENCFLGLVESLIQSHPT